MPDDAELDDLIEEAWIGDRYTHRDAQAVKALARTITIHPKGHPGAVDLIRALLDIASIIRMSGDGPATPDKMMRQIGKEIASVHPLREVGNETIGKLLKAGKAKSGVVRQPRILGHSGR